MQESKPSPLEIVILRGPGGGGLPRQFAATDIAIGRHDPGQAAWQPDLALDFDPRVSRRHARLSREDATWRIEDLGSKRRTWVDGQPVGGEPVELEPGAVIRTGDTLWTFVPDDWLVLRHEDVLVSAPCGAVINYASVHCGTPVVGAVRVRNVGKHASRPLRLDVRIDPYADPCQIDIPPLEGECKASLVAPAFRFDIDLLKRQVQSKRAELHVTLGDAQARRDLVVFSFWDWPFDAAARKSIAAFVAPHNPVVERIVWEAQQELKALSGIDSFELLLRSGREDEERLVLRSLYQHLAERREMHYVAPRVNVVSGLPGISQTVRPPHRIFVPNPSDLEGQGTCLDLAVLMASCLERIGLCPLIMFTESDDGGPRHAFTGCWIGCTPGGRAVIGDVEAIRREIDSGNLLVVECRGFADWVPGRSGKLSFEEAVAEAVDQLAKGDRICAVDVGAARPPYGSISPMESPWEPEVVAAYEEAKSFARKKRREALETIHLLYGLLAAGGTHARWLFREAGVRLEEGLQRLDRAVQTHQASGEPVPTTNYLNCHRLAERYAQQAGAPSLRDEDLIWAFLHTGQRSGSVGDACSVLGINLDRLASLFAHRVPDPEKRIISSKSL